MNTPLSLLLERMRAPLIVLISAYAIATIGFTLIPGYDENGEPWTMSFLNAFYVVSYTGSTIGFGEIPAEFSNAQRMWTIVCIYMTVFAWLFAIGSLVALARDDAFGAALSRRRLQRAIDSIGEPFYLICGYGGSGRILTDNLVRNGRRVVVIDRSRLAIQDLQLRDYWVRVPGLALDAAIPANLVEAGLQNRWCAGLIALTGSDETNLQIALTGRLFNPQMDVVAQAQSEAAASNLASFGTDFVIRPAEEFVRRVSLAITRPAAYRLYERLTEAGAPKRWEPGSDFEGTWLICGQDDYAHLLARRLQDAGIECRRISEEASEQFWPQGSVIGRSSEGTTLEAAGVDTAVGLVAAHDSDSENLSTILTACMTNPDLLVIARENHLHNRTLFEEAGTHLASSVSRMVASAIRPALEAPLVPEFISGAMDQDENWLRGCLERISDRIGEGRLQFWSSRVSSKRTPPIAAAIKAGRTITAGMLTLDPRNRNEKLDALVLMIGRDDETILLPDENLPLAMGDRILFCGTPHSAELIWAVAVDADVVHYLRTGEPRLARRPWRRRAAAS